MSTYKSIQMVYSAYMSTKYIKIHTITYTESTEKIGDRFLQSRLSASGHQNGMTRKNTQHTYIDDYGWQDANQS